MEKARADAALAAALVSQDQTALAKAEIHAPIDGIVLDPQRRAGPDRWRVSCRRRCCSRSRAICRGWNSKIDIDEADIGSVREGQTATFTVDAFPQRRFNARLTSLRNCAEDRQRRRHLSRRAHRSTTARGSLRPGLTANADILVASIDTALLVPNGALRFTPPEDVVGRRRRLPPDATNGELSGRVWVLDGPQARAARSEDRPQRRPHDRSRLRQSRAAAKR